MKCPNCGAEGSGKFCQHCGTQMPDKPEPKTMAGAIHGIAQSVIQEVGEKARYEREHADEIAERKRKEDEAYRKNTLKTMVIFVISMLAVGAVFMFALQFLK